MIDALSVELKLKRDVRNFVFLVMVACLAVFLVGCSNSNHPAGPFGAQGATVPSVFGLLGELHMLAKIVVATRVESAMERHDRVNAALDQLIAAAAERVDSR